MSKLRFINCRNGTVFIVTMWIMIVLASMAIVFANFVRMEAIAARNGKSAVQCEYIVEAAANYALSTIGADEDSQVSFKSNPFEAVEVGEGYFWILRTDITDDRNYDFGLSDHAGRINLNTASVDMLLKLPGMTSELANSIVDWRDSDQDVSVGGAESEYYLLLEDSYSSKDAPLETVEEVFLIKDATEAIVFGEDANRNGVLDWNEDDGEQSSPSDNSDGKLDAGFFHYVTVYSYELNLDEQGQQRVNVNDSNNQSKISEMIEEVCGDRYLQIMNRIRRRRSYSSLIDFYYITEMTVDEFSQIIDSLTTTDEPILPGLVNVNTAAAEVLLCLPELEQTDVDALIEKREKEDTNLDNILWVTEVLSDQKALAIGSYITAKSFQYSADIIAASKDGSAYRRYYVVIDTANGTKEVVMKQSLTNLGWALAPDIIESLRNNTFEQTSQSE